MKPLDDQNKQPCSPYPDDRQYKTIALRCPRCDTWRCWRRYLSWEKCLGITLNEKDHPGQLDDDHEDRNK